MAMIYATVTGKLVVPGTTTGVPGRIEATPMVAGKVLTFPAENTTTLGPAVAQVAADGTLTPSLEIPTDVPEGTYWRLEFFPKGSGLKTHLGDYEIPSASDLADLVPVQVTALTPTAVVDLMDAVEEAKAARDEAVDISNITTSDGVVAALVPTGSGSATSAALSATFARADVAPINVLAAGASPSKTAVENTTILNAVLAQAAAEGRAVYFPATETPIEINDALVVTGPGLRVYGDGPQYLAVRQTVWPKPFIDAGTHDGVTVENIRAINTAPRVQTGFMTAFRGNTAKNYSCFLYSNANNTTLRNCSSDGFNAGFFNLGTAATRLSNAIVDGFEFRDGEFGVFCDYMDGVQIRNVWGDYSFSTGGSQAPHLLYLGAFTDSNMTGVVVDNLRAENSTGGAAFQFKDIIGGTIRNLHATGCAGVASMAHLTDTTIDGVTSLGDVLPASSTEGSLCSISLDPMIRVSIANVNIELVNDAPAIRFLSGEKCRLDNASIRVAHTSAQSGEKGDIEIRGEWEVNRPRVVNTGANAWNSIVIFDGSGAVVRDPATTGVRIPVKVRDSATGTRVYYDAARLGVHGTVGLQPLDMGFGGANDAKAIPIPSPTATFGRRNLVVANFDTASGSGKAPGTVNTGQTITTAAGTWAVESGYLRKTNAVVGLIHVESGQADVEVSVDVIWRDANGIAFRVIDTNNYLFVRIRDAVRLSKRVASVETELAASPAIVYTTDRRYRLMVRAFGAEVKVYLDGDLVITHTLAGGDETTFATATKHGLRAHTDTACKFTDLRIDSLR